MKTKKQTPKPRKDYKLLLVLDAAAQKQLQVVHKNTAEKTATKAIIKAMFQSDYFMKRYQEERDVTEKLQLELSRYKSAVSSFASLLKVMNELNNSKSVTNTRSENKGKKGLQLLIDAED